MFKVFSKTDYYYSDNEGVWHNEKLIWKNNDRQAFDDEPVFEIVSSTYIVVQNVDTIIDIICSFVDKKVYSLDTELEQISKIVSGKGEDIFAFSGLQRGKHNEYNQGIIKLYKNKNKNKFSEYKKYMVSGLYNEVHVLDEDNGFIIFYASNKENTSKGKIYKYDILNEKEKILLDDFFMYDFFKYIKGTAYAIVSQKSNIFIYDIEKEEIILDKYHYIETKNNVIIDINYINNIFYIMLSDEIYTYNTIFQKKNIIKTIDILYQSLIMDGGFSYQNDYVIYKDEDNNIKKEICVR